MLTGCLLAVYGFFKVTKEAKTNIKKQMAQHAPTNDNEDL